MLRSCGVGQVGATKGGRLTRQIPVHVATHMLLLLLLMMMKLWLVGKVLSLLRLMQLLMLELLLVQRCEVLRAAVVCGHGVHMLLLVQRRASGHLLLLSMVVLLLVLLD